MRNRLPVAQLREPYWKRQPGETVIAYATYRHFSRPGSVRAERRARLTRHRP